MESESGEGPSSFSATDDTTDAELLKRAWRTEKAAPEILMFEKDLVQRSRGQIQLVEENVELSILNGDDPLTVSLNQMDLDRTLYLLRSYLRTRLQKIEKYTVHIHKNNELWERLSEEEQNFAKRCIEDLDDHLDKSVLSKLPDRYQSSLNQSPISEEDDMVPEPDLDTFVICRTTKSLGALQLDNSGEEDPVVLEPNHIYAIRYRPIKPRVYDGQIDLV